MATLLYLTTGCFDKGGISRYNRYQIEALRRILGKDRIRVLSIHGPEPRGFEEPFAVDYWAGREYPLRNVRFAARALREAMDGVPSVVLAAHVHLSGLGLALATMLKAKCIVNVYGLEVWSGMRVDARLGLRKADSVISDCHFTAKYVMDHGLRPEGGAPEVVWDCVDTSRFRPGSISHDVAAKYGVTKPTEGFRVLTLGRLCEGARHKGYERLLVVMKHLVKVVPSARLLIGGDGDLRDELARNAAQMGISDRVQYLGNIHDSDLPDVYRLADVFSLVSDRGVGRGEGVPLTPLEAAGCGVPIVVGNHDGSSEAVGECPCGVSLDPFDLDRHTQVLAELARDEERRRKMGAAGRARIETEFSFERFIAKHLRLVRQWGMSTEGTRTEGAYCG